ncbi:hypothetical protein Zmor_000381 [Zophobas morio]|uniref:Uncharacterized protein n=1 Tax=Zophobas morio TaxID=2755281 RepID=A0AA38MRP9_9CUCU|nr:hypothetical protein Zmor_000381 [Zophobas morio]
MTEAVKKIVKVDTTTSVPNCLTWIKEEAQCKGYYTYIPGVLNHGAVHRERHVDSLHHADTRVQAAEFRKMKSTACEQHNIVKNVRPIQTPPVHKKLDIIYARSHRKSSE